ncbi:hypothetical protein A1Q2_01153 [Trichosporon asahii var. asahii CBS 8904]|uniref:Copper acquisition factor BIM1-like domain-containing protein n=1 Tax=Trichosporon asahii var. asahii (strain CBS 8904) TaxID=1220162 RepID=K1VVL5_TRIAC|nr:hypothetical protein A1Q2_01153 [Trichosporon asahii var. asahii CBS 8904]
MLSLLATALAASMATAHFTLDYPETRGFDEDKETQFCGGFATAATRQPFPLKGPAWINNHHKKATVDAFVSLSTDPQSFDDFNKTSNGTSIPHLTDFFQVSEGEACWNIDFTSLGLDLKNGSEVTLQVRFSGCSDLILLSDYQVPANETCNNDAAAGAQSNTSETGAGHDDNSHASSSAAPSATASQQGGASPILARSGALVVVAIAFAALF